MNDLAKIKKVAMLDGFFIEIFFQDGEEKVVDFKPFLNAKSSLTKPLLEKAFFGKVKVLENGRGLQWPNGYDFCADNLEYHIEGLQKMEVHSTILS